MKCSLVRLAIGMIVLVQIAGCGYGPLQITPVDTWLATEMAANTQTSSAISKQKLSKTLPFPATPSSTPTVTRSATASLTPTQTQTSSPAPKVKLNVAIITCDTSVDVFNRLGEVTNAYVLIQNIGTMDATQVEVVLKGSDEEKIHPNKSFLVQNLPLGDEIPIKLTVDTQDSQPTRILVDVSTAEKVTATATKISCKSTFPDMAVIASLGELFVVRKSGAR
jgi:hypothetical protein